jgi:hypothetical protein
LTVEGSSRSRENADFIPPGRLFWIEVGLGEKNMSYQIEKGWRKWAKSQEKPKAKKSLTAKPPQPPRKA